MMLLVIVIIHGSENVGEYKRRSWRGWTSEYPPCTAFACFFGDNGKVFGHWTESWDVLDWLEYVLRSRNMIDQSGASFSSIRFVTAAKIAAPKTSVSPDGNS
jgi:hypothetical protein